MVKLCDINPEAESKLVTNGYEDKSGVGVHYMDVIQLALGHKAPTAVTAMGDE